MIATPRPGRLDFLDRLVDKALDQDRPLEPRVLSLFEPRPAHSHVQSFGLDLELSATSPARQERSPELEGRAGESPAGRVAHERRGQERDDDVLERRERGVLRAVSRSDELLDTRSGRGIEQPAAAHGEQLAPRPARDRAADAPSVGRSHVEPSPPIASLVAPHARVARVDAESDAHGTLMAHDRPEIATATPVVRSMRREETRHEEAPALDATPARGQDGGPPRAVLVPVAVPAVATYAASPSRQARLADGPDIGRSESPTSVTVTIGRLDVRALPAAPTRTPARADTPRPLGLEDYLRQRGGGR